MSLNKMQIHRLVRKINKLAPKMRQMTDEELQAQTEIFRKQLKAGMKEKDILPEAFATVREADYRVLGMFPYEVQVIGALILNEGAIAEMRTGEGKTLTATMPLYLNALSGKGAMLVTPNDYLAARDEENLAPVYKWLGLTVSKGFDEKLSREGKKAAPAVKRKWYASDIVYTTASSLAFDYLFDNLATSKEGQYLRPYNYVIVDEVDAVMIIDEMLISPPPHTSGGSEGYITGIGKLENTIVLLMDTRKIVGAQEFEMLESEVS